MIEDFSLAFNMSLVPICLDLSFFRKGYNPKAAFLPIDEITFV